MKEALTIDIVDTLRLPHQSFVKLLHMPRQGTTLRYGDIEIPVMPDEGADKNTIDVRQDGRTILRIVNVGT